MKQVVIISIALLLPSGCVSNKAFRSQQGKIVALEEAVAQNNEELVVLRKEISQSRRSADSAAKAMDPDYIQSQFAQNQSDMKSLIDEVAEMALTLDSLGENVVSSDREIVNMIRALETRINALGNTDMSPEQLAALTPDTKQMEANSKEIDNIQAELSALKKHVQGLQAGSLAAASQQSSIEASGTEKAEYEAARDEYYKGNFNGAITKLDAFASKYPRSIYAGNAHYWKGESYYAQADFSQAMREFNKVISSYPDSWKVADSQLKIGMCYMNMGNHQQARTELNKLKTDHPGYSRMDIADRLLSELK